MKMKSMLLIPLVFLSCTTFSQYIGVRARYTESRLIDDAPNPPRRENRLLLTFFDVSPEGVYTPTTLTNYDLWIYRSGFQYGNAGGGVIDSAGNNYPGYPWPAPKAVAYFNTLGTGHIDCDPNLSTHYIVNGHELDCGFVPVSYWDIDQGTMLPLEIFPAPNICLPFYQWPHPYFTSPGNLNFDWTPLYPGPPYNFYNYTCTNGIQQTVIRGVIGLDSGESVVSLPVRFAEVRASIDEVDLVTIRWSNLTESDIVQYTIEQSGDGLSFQSIGTRLPTGNTGTRADYLYSVHQQAPNMYYRIKATEHSGATFYSPVLPVTKPDVAHTLSPQLSVYPNPLAGPSLTIRLTAAPAGRYLLALISPSGQQVKQKMIEHAGGELLRQVEMVGMLPGLYRVILRSAVQQYKQSILFIH